ncbi:MAG: ABC transporter permease, partial [Betaproteobacteria bacterium]
MQLVSALMAITRRTFIMMGRYVFNTVSALISIYMVFCLAFFGMKAFAAASASRSLDGTFEGTIVGFFVWTLAIFGYSSLSWDLINEAQTGTLEQLYLCPA